MTTVAWIVAIEYYGVKGAAEGGLASPGPVGKLALELAEAITERDSQTRILLSHSLPETETYRLQLARLPASILQTDATQQDIQNALNLLHGEGTLLIYWIGHGVMSSNRRLLLCADSVDIANLRTIDVDSLLTRLRGSEFPRTQMGFFDACAQLVPSSNALSLGGRTEVPTRQYFYFSASAAQVAAADTGPSGFSGTVIKLLTDPDREFPPNPSPLFADLERRFDDLQLSTRAFPLQRTNGSGEIWDSIEGEHTWDHFARAARCSLCEFDHLRISAGGYIDDETLSTALRFYDLDAMLERLDEPGNDVPLVHRHLVKDAWERLQLARALELLCVGIGLSWSEWQELCQQVVALDNLKTSSADSVASLMLNLLDQGNPDRGLDSCIRVLSLARRRANRKAPGLVGNFETEARALPQLAGRWDAAVMTLPRPDGPVFLLLGLHRDSQSGTLSIAESWLYHDNEIDSAWKVSPVVGSLVEQINEFIQMAKIRYDRPLTVELLAPSALLCSPRELFELVDSELGTNTWLEAENTVVLRWYDRMKGNLRFMPGNWMHQAQSRLSYLGGNPNIDIEWIDEPVTAHIVGLPFPGPSTSEPKRNKEPFFKALLKGDPWMCWPRVEPGDSIAFKSRVREFIQLHGVSEGRQPLAIAEALRLARSHGENSDLCSLWLLIDDPKRNPFKWNFTETNQRTAI